MTNRQPSWNMLEAIVLLEAFISTKDGLLSRTDAISRASSDLRKMALNQGTNIDQTFRNESGISFQMHSMESAFFGKTMFKPATKLFTEAARICGMGSPSIKGNLLTTRFGPFQSLVFIITDAPLECDAPFEGNLCDGCMKCAEACPGNATIMLSIFFIPYRFS